MTDDRITTSTQLAAMSPDQIDQARLAGLIDLQAISDDRAARDAAARERTAAIRARIRQGSDALAIWREETDRTPPAA